MPYGILTYKEEWVHPDSPLEELPGKVILHTPLNGKRGIQLVMETGGDSARISVENNDNVGIEIFQMIDIPVDYNSESSTAQNGYFVIEDRALPKPDYCTRKAPFRVYDCLKPVADTVDAVNGRIAVYICFIPMPSLKSGESSSNDSKVDFLTLTLKVEAGEQVYEFDVFLNVYNVSIPAETLNVTNWFSLDCISSYHGVEHMSPEFFKMLGKYARAMRRTRQTHFFIEMSPKDCVVSRYPLRFDFSRYKETAEVFFAEGFKTMELGYFALKCSGADMFSDEIYCSMDPTVKINSDEGYFFTVEFAKAMAEFLQANNWEDKVTFHVCDEPDYHLKSEEAIVNRKQQYYKISNIIRKYIPSARIIEAVKGPEFKSGVDIWVPLTKSYEEHKSKFDELIGAGEEVWTYVCCCPGGHYLNRFMDIDLIKPRLIFWGCSKYDLAGYLHWGFNQYMSIRNPFEMSCCPNDKGLWIGTSLPSGDNFIVYPGDDGPWISMRLEAQRRGIEDYELLKLLKQKDPVKYKELMDRTFRSYAAYNSNTDEFENVFVQILHSLCK